MEGVRCLKIDFITSFKFRCKSNIAFDLEVFGISALDPPGLTWISGCPYHGTPEIVKSPPDCHRGRTGTVATPYNSLLCKKAIHRFKSWMRIRLWLFLSDRIRVNSTWIRNPCLGDRVGFPHRYIDRFPFRS